MSTHERAWLGLDVGTSSTKAVLVAEDGTILGRGSASYGTTSSGPAVAEQNPSDYVSAAAAAVAACGVDQRAPSGVGLVGQTPTLVLVDAAGAPVRPALTWQDRRAVAEAAELAESLGDPLAVVGTSLPWDPSALPAKLLWLARHEPERLRATSSLLQPKDFIARTLTGHATTDPWSSKGLCHVGTHEPCLPVLDAAGVDAALVPPVRSAWDLNGLVTTSAAELVGIPADTPVTVGWSDALAGMLGVGAFAEPRSFALTGTSDIVGQTLAAVPDDASPLYSVPSSCAPMGVVYGPTSTSGASLVWLADLLETTVPDLINAAAALDSTADIPIFLPYLAGERAPIWRPDLTASFIGLRQDHRRSELARGIMTGIACSERHVLDVTDAIAAPAPADNAQPVHTGGAGAAHRGWLQTRGEILARPVVAYDEPSLTAIGAAMLAAMTATGRSAADLESMRPIGRTWNSPSETGERRYRRYREESAHLCLNRS